MDQIVLDGVSMKKQMSQAQVPKAKYAQTGIRAVLSDQRALNNPFVLMVQVPDMRRPWDARAWKGAKQFNWFAYSVGKLKARDLSSVVVWGTCIKKSRPTKIQRENSNGNDDAFYKDNQNNKRRNAQRGIDQMMKSAGFGGKGFRDLLYDFEVVGACKFSTLGHLNAALYYKRRFGKFMTASSVMKDRVTSRVMSTVLAPPHPSVDPAAASGSNTSRAAANQSARNPTPNMLGVSDSVIESDLMRVLEKDELEHDDLHELLPRVRVTFAELAESFTEFIAKTPLALIGHELKAGNAAILETLRVSECDTRCTSKVKLMEHNPFVTDDFSRRVHAGQLNQTDALKLHTALMNTHRQDGQNRLVTNFPNSEACEFITWPGTAMGDVMGMYKQHADAIHRTHALASRTSKAAMNAARKQHDIVANLL